MKTKFTILIAAGLLFAGATQAQTVAMNRGMDFRNDRHEMVRDHQAVIDDRHEVRKDHADLMHDHRNIHKGHKVLRHDRKVIHHHRVVKQKKHTKF